MNNEESSTHVYTSPRRSDDHSASKKNRSKFWFLGLIIAVGLGYFAGLNNDHLIAAIRGNLGDSSVRLDVSSLQSTYSSIRNNFDGDIDQKKLIEGANKGMVDALGDQYTVFMSSSETEEFNKSLSGDIGGGIGVEVALRGDQPTVVRVLRDNPAEKAGVMVGDVFMAVNDESVIGKSVNEVVSKVRGEEGTTVKVKFFRSGSEEVISITREKVNNPSVYGSVVDGVGVMTVLRFDNDTGSLARRLAREFKEASVKGVILDLRGNGGGYVSAAKDLSSIWLNDKVVVVEKTGDRVVDEVKSGSDAILGDVSTIVLVNESSASASEIVAGALRDHGVAKLYGVATFGKGSVQRLIDLPDGATLKVTIAKWYTPSGLNISEKGISPDVKVDKTADESNAGKDPQLEAARSALK